MNEFRLNLLIFIMLFLLFFIVISTILQITIKERGITTITPNSDSFFTSANEEKSGSRDLVKEIIKNGNSYDNAYNVEPSKRYTNGINLSVDNNPAWAIYKVYIDKKTEKIGVGINYTDVSFNGPTLQAWNWSRSNFEDILPNMGLGTDVYKSVEISSQFYVNNASGYLSISVNNEGPDNTDLNYLKIIYRYPDTPPSCSILSPELKHVNGIVTITGTASDPDESEGDYVENVEVKVDNGYWQNTVNTCIHYCKWKYDWKTYDYQDGNYTIYARAYDGESYSEIVSKEYVVDNTPPEKLSILINENAEYTNSKFVSLNLSAVDFGSGLGEMAFSNDGKNWSNWEKYSNKSSWSLSSGDGLKKVYFKVRDVLGNVAEPKNDTIILDATPPNISYLLMNNGSEYTNSSNITISISAYDFSGIDKMSISNDGIVWSEWLNYSDFIYWKILSDSDGIKTIYLKLKDNAGNVAPSVNARITLDTVPPNSSVNILSSYSPESFIVSWYGFDKTSGIRWYDVQYKENDGNWGDWLKNTNLTSAVFTGKENHTYYFRVRAMDKAGNLEDYGEAEAFTTVRSEEVPICTITYPSEKAVLSGNVTIIGIASSNVVTVYVKIDDENWQTPNGILNWSFLWDTNKVGDGEHIIRVKALAKEQLFSECLVNVVVNNSYRLIVSINYPLENQKVSGVVIIKGTAVHPILGRNITHVDVRIDNEEWKVASGTENWSIEWDTNEVADGLYTICVRAYDGLVYSMEESIEVEVRNVSDKAERIDRQFWCGILVVLVIATLMGAGMYLLRWKK
ncbi:MAG: Ig-like domain-containing protein [Candidatus Thermoplasmatota archaeon]